MQAQTFSAALGRVANRKGLAYQASVKGGMRISEAVTLMIHLLRDRRVRSRRDGARHPDRRPLGGIFAAL